MKKRMLKVTLIMKETSKLLDMLPQFIKAMIRLEIRLNPRTNAEKKAWLLKIKLKDLMTTMTIKSKNLKQEVRIRILEAQKATTKISKKRKVRTNNNNKMKKRYKRRNSLNPRQLSLKIISNLEEITHILRTLSSIMSLILLSEDSPCSMIAPTQSKCNLLSCQRPMIS